MYTKWAAISHANLRLYGLILCQRALNESYGHQLVGRITTGIDIIRNLKACDNSSYCVKMSTNLVALKQI